MSLKIALAGNPNSGKTTMFNTLTGSNQYVGNWPGVTVEKKEGKLKSDKNVILQDLPGIYSLSPYTLEEVVTRNYLVNDKPDAIINIIDASNIERNLYLTTQLIELGIPVVIALNMIDIVRKNGDTIDLDKLSKALGCKVFETSALKGEGLSEAAAYAVKIATDGSASKNPPIFRGNVEHAIAHIEESLENRVPERYLRWYAVKVFERDQEVLRELALDKEEWEHIDGHIKDCEEELDDDAESIITIERYDYIGNLVSSCVNKLNKSGTTRSDKIDAIVTNRFLALPIFGAVMFFVYYISISTLGSWAADWINETLFADLISANLAEWFVSINVAPWLSGLVINGIISGVGAVLGFLPQMIILFLMLSILEDIGYMSRIAFIMDKVFRRFGLSGKSFIPMLIGSGCSVPGIMASRTIENERDRRMTIMTTSFIPCGAKMPFVGLIAGALFGDSGWIATSAYFIGVAAVVISGILLKKTKAFAGDEAPFVMELPPYHAPLGKNVFRATWERSSSFVKKAGTLILASSVILWFLQAFSLSGGLFHMTSDNNTSLLAYLGRSIAPIFAPLGFGHWQAAVASLTGLLAKENIVATFGILYGYVDVSANGSQYWPKLAQDFTALSAYSFMIFNLLCAPCFAAMGAIRREMNNKNWTLIAIGYLCVFAYVICLIVNQLGLLIMGGSFGVWTAVALILLAGLIYLVVRKNPYVKSGVK
ncbi:MAG: ferrous iron transport protein B [Clostridiales bacterium]|jgi:ferrous iron transport protein B|nr:ferrous iron transport protein B [Clostridiales bacterium]